MKIGALFTSFQGRIGRRSWWLGYSIIMVVSIVGGLLIEPRVFDLEVTQTVKPSFWLSQWQLAMLVPVLALTVKRLNDRNHPVWLSYLWGCMALAGTFISHLGFPDDPLKISTTEWAILTPLMLFGLWMLIDNGFLKGTSGPNQYGPDPLGSSDTSPVSVSAKPTSGRTRSAWARDAIIGTLGTVIALYLVVPGLSIESTVKWGLQKLEPRALTIDLERRANGPAWKAYQEGRAAARSKDQKKAVEYFDRAIELYGPQNDTAAHTYYSRAYALRTLNRPDEALESDNMSVKLDPDTAYRYASRARSYRNLHRYSAALEDYERAIHLNPDDGDYYIGRGRMLDELGRSDHGLKSYRDALSAAERDYADDVRFQEQHPSERSKKAINRSRNNRNKILARAHFEIGKVMHQGGKLNLALEEFKTALKFKPDYRWVYLHRGWTYEKQDQIENARSDYEKAVELGEPNDWLKLALERVR